MQKDYVVLEGQVFVVELLSNLGSTNYGWCVSGLPQDIIVMGTENVSVGGRYTSTSLQRFYFGALSKGEKTVDISFTLNRWSNVDDVKDNFTAKVKIIKSDSEEFASYSENAANITIPYGFVRSDDVQNSCQDYGLPCSVNDAAFKYGYPCGVQDANLKYGYPCGVQDANVKYGYSCGTQNTNLMYGYQCGANDAAFKYGYPCGVNDATFKYGYLCMDNANGMRMYAAPF